MKKNNNDNILKTIYRFTNKLNGKQYIGSTIININKRYNQHIYCANHIDSSKYNYPLYLVIRKYGIDNFSFDIIEQLNCTEQELRQKEQEYIIKFNTLSPNGYNQTINTEHPINDIETYKKISETKRNKAQNICEIKNNIIINTWRSIIDCAEDTKLDERKIASVCRGERKTTDNRVFRFLDDNNNIIIPEYKRDEYKGEKGTTQIQKTSRQVGKIDFKTNEIIEIYPTIALAGRKNNIDPSGISKTCKGLRSHCGGFKWIYIEGENKI